jgi:hypothetical protein
MKPFRWLFDDEDMTWHLWGVPDPQDGDAAWCGNVKDEHCSVEGQPDVFTKCEACLDAFRAAGDST